MAASPGDLHQKQRLLWVPSVFSRQGPVPPLGKATLYWQLFQQDGKLGFFKIMQSVPFKTCTASVGTHL